jgi:SulP family sulfate permease
VHIASFGRGDHFGDMAFLDRGARSADAVAETNVELFAISRARFDALLKDEPALEVGLFSHLARSLAFRLRQADGEIAALEEA